MGIVRLEVQISREYSRGYSSGGRYVVGSYSVGIAIGVIHWWYIESVYCRSLTKWWSCNVGISVGLRKWGVCIGSRVVSLEEQGLQCSDV